MIKFYTHWRNWSFGKTFRLNGSQYWGWNPYTSYCFGPFEWRVYGR